MLNRLLSNRVLPLSQPFAAVRTSSKMQLLIPPISSRCTTEPTTLFSKSPLSKVSEVMVMTLPEWLGMESALLMIFKRHWGMRRRAANAKINFTAMSSNREFAVAPIANSTPNATPKTDSGKTGTGTTGSTTEVLEYPLHSLKFAPLLFMSFLSPMPTPLFEPQEDIEVHGTDDEVVGLCAHLQAEGLFAKRIDFSGIPFHSPAMTLVRDEMLAAMRRAVPEPKQPDWVSTSIPETLWEEQLTTFCSADYPVNNACSPVLFYEALQKVPPKAITVEIAPHVLMQVILRRPLHKTCVNIGLMNNKAEDELRAFQQALGRDGRLAGSGAVAASASYTIDPFATDSKETFLLGNSATHRKKACAVELPSTDMLKHSPNCCKSHPLPEIDGLV